MSSVTFSNEAPSTINSGGVELNELEILEGKANTSNHGVSISGAGVGRGARKVGSSVSLFFFSERRMVSEVLFQMT